MEGGSEGSVGAVHDTPCSECAKRGIVCRGPPVGTCKSCAKLRSKCEKSRGQVRKASMAKGKGKEEVLGECTVYAKSCVLILSFFFFFFLNALSAP